MKSSSSIISFFSYGSKSLNKHFSNFKVGMQTCQYLSLDRMSGLCMKMSVFTPQKHNSKKSINLHKFNHFNGSDTVTHFPQNAWSNFSQNHGVNKPRNNQSENHWHLTNFCSSYFYLHIFTELWSEWNAVEIATIGAVVYRSDIEQNK